MDEIILTLRASKTPPASAPVGGEMSAAEVDANFSALKTAADQLNSEKLSDSDATTVGTKAIPIDADLVLGFDSAASSAPVTFTKAQLLAAVNAAISAVASDVSDNTSDIAANAAAISANLAATTIALAAKQATLVNQSNIKSINNQSLVGSGNITIAGSGEGLSPIGLWDFWHNYRISTTGAAAGDMFVGAAISSGTNTTAIPTGGQGGFNSHGVLLRSGTTANGGYKYQTTSMVADYFGTISKKFRSQFLWKTAFTGRMVRLGFHDSVTSADAVDGAYFEVDGDVCRAKTANNSTRTTDATTITLALDTAYTFDIDVNAAGDAARFRVYGGGAYAAPLMDVTITTNIPTVVARSFGCGVVATEASTTASDIGILYSLGMGTVSGFARFHGEYVPVATAPAAFTVGQWSATVGDGTVTLAVVTPPDDGGSAITSYEYRRDGGTATTFTSPTNVTSSNGTEYDFEVRAVNAVGAGPWSDVKARTPAASGGGGSLSIVNAGAPTDSYGTFTQHTVPAVASGNALIVMVQTPTPESAPTISDSASGTWGAPLFTYAGAEVTTRYYARANITDAPTWVRATTGVDHTQLVAAVEVSGAGASVSLDASGGAFQSTTTDWTYPFTSTVANVLLMASHHMLNGSVPTGTAPLTAYGADGNYRTYARGIFPTAGANTGQITLAEGRGGDKCWAAFKPGA